MISYEHKCIFVHIPKCAGSSIENVLWPALKRTESNLWMGFISKFNNKYQTGGLQHLFAIHIKQEVGNDIFNRFFKFSIVRNPWDKAVSQYIFMDKRDDLREYIGMKKKCSFLKYLELIQKRIHVQWESQYKFLTDNEGKIIVNFIGRFEKFSNDIQIIFEKIGLSLSAIPHINKGSHKPYYEYYNNESIEMVRHIYRKDIELFNYVFQPPGVSP